MAVIRKEQIQKFNRLKEIRIARGYKITEFANVIDMNRPDVHYWETGRRTIPEKHFDILCEVLNVSEEMLLGIDQSPIPDVEATYDKLTPEDFPKPMRERKQIITNKKGYVFIYDPLNEMATQGGYVPLHRLVMSLHIKRSLTDKEVVHHIDENPSNNKLSNLMLFKSNVEHIRHHKEVRDKEARAAAVELANELLKQ